MLPTEVLKIVSCPASGQKLSLADSDLISKLNANIRAGTLINRGKKTVNLEIQSGLIREDMRYLYPIRSGIPILLIDDAILIEGQFGA